MRGIPLLVLLVMSIVTSNTNAVELAKIPRVIQKEPAYTNAKPLYALLVFGPEAKNAGMVGR